MKALASILVLFVLLLCACSEPPPPPPEKKPPPPPPSANEIYETELSPALQPLRDGLSGAPIDEADKNAKLNDLRAAKAKQQSSPHGPEALGRASAEVDSFLTQARQKGMWPMVLVACQYCEVLQPGNMKVKLYADMAALQLAKPQVRIKGFHEDKTKEEKYVFLEVKLQGEDWKTIDAVRVGDEFLEKPNTLRLVEIIGNNEGVRIEYTGIEGDVFDVMRSTKAAPAK